MTLPSFLATSLLALTYLVETSPASTQGGVGLPAPETVSGPRVSKDVHGQLGSEPTWFSVAAKEGQSAYELLGQATPDGVLILTPSNGFFDRGVRAKGEAEFADVANGKKGKSTLIANDYAVLTGWTDRARTLRWHIWVEQPGPVVATLRLGAGMESPGATVELTLGQETRRLALGKGAGDGVRVAFELATPGKHTFLMRADVPKASAGAELSQVELSGAAMAGARVLRARWRPAAVHGGYRATTLESTDMWVMASRSASPYTSYSPITTPFGYFGVSFGEDRRGGPGCNFSMWSKGDLPLGRQPHLLALGSPGAQFSGFGHEGTGVKPRGWNPFSHRPKDVVLALRRERDGDFDTYYGYFIDGEGEWELYAVGRKWRGRAKPMWPGSFVEVPGPPDRQRSGDQVRKVLRKGWARGAHGEWHRLDVLRAGASQRQNKRWGKDDAGWFTFEMGGMEHFSEGKRDMLLTKEQRDEPLPNYLEGAKAEGLFRLPAKFGAVTAAAVGTEATLEFELLEVGEGASAIVYFGKRDCLAFAPRELHGTERNATALQEGGTWSRSVPLGRVHRGVNSVSLPDLDPGATYYLRILVTSDRGRMWTFETHQFTVPTR